MKKTPRFGLRLGVNALQILFYITLLQNNPNPKDMHNEIKPQRI